MPVFDMHPSMLHIIRETTFPLLILDKKRAIMYWKIQSNTTYIDYVMIRLYVSTMK
jgi:hypothetical protein